MKGSYVLLMKLDKNRKICIGKLGGISFNKGFYVYVGSALNGLGQRIRRHLRSDKKMHWHIDYFLEKAYVIAVFYLEGKHRQECNIAHRLRKHFLSVEHFGSSDCACNSHLFYGERNKLIAVINELGMKEYQKDARVR
jgi:Uri superfamily endonuclease